MVVERRRGQPPSWSSCPPEGQSATVAKCRTLKRPSTGTAILPSTGAVEHRGMATPLGNGRADTHTNRQTRGTRVMCARQEQSRAGVGRAWRAPKGVSPGAAERRSARSGRVLDRPYVKFGRAAPGLTERRLSRPRAELAVAERPRASNTGAAVRKTQWLSLAGMGRNGRAPGLPSASGGDEARAAGRHISPVQRQTSSRLGFNEAMDQQRHGRKRRASEQASNEASQQKKTKNKEASVNACINE